ncbi:alpha/beta hydrolase [Streptomyces sp. Ru71]|uniref:alpha/beta hydrolase n=1 Tax=Streptomyces sp. Ru71 TaxID=2080746 RepID=UPI002156270A|nr:alpha/beta hydrolase [Streptomyces sp. Ru71]
MITGIRRSLIGVAGLLISLTGASAPANPLERYHHQHVEWTSCVRGPHDEIGKRLERNGARCAAITVPLDYDAPGGRTTTVAVSRIAATDTAHRIGTLVLVAGGPGDSALSAGAEPPASLAGIASRFDVVGYDPRFVGRSEPLDCEWPTGFAFRSAGLTRGSFERQVAFQKDLADRCRSTQPTLLPYVTTRNAARDLDVVRAALGENRISYYGFSYATYLGTVYTQLFPGRFDRAVFDGPVNPLRYDTRLLRDTAPANEAALSAWATWAADRHDAYGLGRTRAEVLDRINGIERAAAQEPLIIGVPPEVFRVDDTIIPTLLVSGLADDSDGARKALADTLTVLAKAAGRKPALPSTDLRTTLTFLTTGADSAYGSAATAVLCGDVAAPRDPETYWHDIQRSRRTHPLFGPAVHNITPCAFWPTPPREQPTTVDKDAPVLLAATTGDPRTPYEGARTLRSLLPSSRLVTLQGGHHHTVGENNACVNATIRTYLTAGHLPPHDVYYREP